MEAATGRELNWSAELAALVVALPPGRGSEWAASGKLHVQADVKLERCPIFVPAVRSCRPTPDSATSAESRSTIIRASPKKLPRKSLLPYPYHHKSRRRSKSVSDRKSTRLNSSHR